MNCNNCDAKNEPDAYKCQQCGYGIACRPTPPKRDPVYLGDRAIENESDKLGRMFVCAACKSCGGKVRRVATTGSGISRVFDIQSKDFVAITCQFCKAVQLYDSPEFNGANPWKWLDYCWSIAAAIVLIVGFFAALFTF